MKIGDRVCLRDDPSLRGIICGLSGHKAIVRWTSHTTTATFRHALQLESFEDCEPMTRTDQMLSISERLAHLRKHQAAMRADSPQLPISKGEHNG